MLRVYILYSIVGNVPLISVEQSQFSFHSQGAFYIVDAIETKSISSVFGVSRLGAQKKWMKCFVQLVCSGIEWVNKKNWLSFNQKPIFQVERRIDFLERWKKNWFLAKFDFYLLKGAKFYFAVAGALGLPLPFCWGCSSTRFICVLCECCQWRSAEVVKCN